MKLLPYGPTAVLAEFDDLDAVMAHAAAWRASAIPGVIDVVPAARTVLIVHDGSWDPSSLTAVAATAPASAAPLVTIPVRYDGADLADVAASCDLTTADVIELHAAAEYICAFCGFMPGFSYLVGLDPRLVLPRRPTPRTRVPAGAVAIASGFTAVYPGDSPGGWHLLGTTDVSLWDDTRPISALVPPGTRVRFTPA